MELVVAGPEAWPEGVELIDDKQATLLIEAAKKELEKVA